jgi:hypothetical protein
MEWDNIGIPTAPHEMGGKKSKGKKSKHNNDNIFDGDPFGIESMQKQNSKRTKDSSMGFGSLSLPTADDFSYGGQEQTQKIKIKGSGKYVIQLADGTYIRKKTKAQAKKFLEKHALETGSHGRVITLGKKQNNESNSLLEMGMSGAKGIGIPTMEDMSGGGGFSMYGTNGIGIPTPSEMGMQGDDLAIDMSMMNGDITSMGDPREFSYGGKEGGFGLSSKKVKINDKKINLGKRQLYEITLATPMGSIGSQYIPVSDDEGNPMTDEQGNTIFEKTTVKTGGLKVIGEGLGKLQDKIRTYEESRGKKIPESIKDELNDIGEGGNFAVYSTDVKTRVQSEHTFPTRDQAERFKRKERTKGNITSDVQVG